MGPLPVLPVAAENFLLGLEFVEGVAELLLEVFLDSILAAWVLPFNPSPVFCYVISLSAPVGCLLLHVG